MTTLSAWILLIAGLARSADPRIRRREKRTRCGQWKKARRYQYRCSSAFLRCRRASCAGSLPSRSPSRCGNCRARLFVANNLFFAPLSAVALRAGELWSTGELQTHIWVSFVEFAGGLRARRRGRDPARHRAGRIDPRARPGRPVDLDALRHADHRARPLVHPVARHRRRLEDRHRLPHRGVPDPDQHGGGPHQHRPHADRSGALARRERDSRSTRRCDCPPRCRSSSRGCG